MERSKLVRAIVAASPEERLAALAPLLPALGEALEAAGESDTDVTVTRALMERADLGEPLDENELGHALQLAWFRAGRLYDEHATDGGGNAALLLQLVTLVQLALIDALGLDAQRLLTMPVSDPLSDPPEEPASYLVDLELEPEPLGGLLALLDGPPHAPAVERALDAIAQRIGTDMPARS